MRVSLNTHTHTHTHTRSLTHLDSHLVGDPAFPILTVAHVEPQPHGVQVVPGIQPPQARTQVDGELATLLVSQGPVLAREEDILVSAVELNDVLTEVGAAHDVI